MSKKVMYSDMDGVQEYLLSPDKMLYARQGLNHPIDLPRKVRKLKVKKSVAKIKEEHEPNPMSMSHDREFIKRLKERLEGSRRKKVL